MEYDDFHLRELEEMAHSLRTVVGRSKEMKEIWRKRIIAVIRTLLFTL